MITNVRIVVHLLLVSVVIDRNMHLKKVLDLVGNYVRLLRSGPSILFQKEIEESNFLSSIFFPSMSPKNYVFSRLPQAESQRNEKCGS